MTFTPVPKPPRREKARRKPLPPSSSRPPRTAPPKPRNAKRKASEFARTYHSNARVAFVKSLPCAWCKEGFGTSDNAHTTGGGMGRKGDYTTIAPLCRRHHRMFDEHDAPFNEPWVRTFVADASVGVERRWLAFSGGAENEEETR